MSKTLSFAYKWCGPKWPITNNRVPTLVDINHAMNDGDIDDDVQAPVVFQLFKNREIISNLFSNVASEHSKACK